MAELIRQTVRANGDARGLAVIISNDYMNGISNQRRLYGAIKDAEAIRKTFEHLNFAVIVRSNATKVETRSLIIGVADYEHYPKKYDCFAVVFAGHGSGKPMILSSDDEEVDLNEELLQPLDSQPLRGIPKLIFIDACRIQGDEDRPLSVPDDFLVAYSTRYGHESTENEEGGIWMQKLAAELKTSSKSVPSIVTDVNKAVRSASQGAQLLNTNVDIHLGGHQPSGTTQVKSPAVNPGKAKLRPAEKAAQLDDTRDAPTVNDLIGKTRNSKDQSYNLMDEISGTWDDIGRSLGLSGNKLSNIREEISSQNKRFTEVMDTWVRNGNRLPNSGRYPHSWAGLYSLVCDNDAANIADIFICFMYELTFSEK